MKRYIALFLIFAFVLSLVGCHLSRSNMQTPSASGSGALNLIEKDNESYLVLPVSKQEVKIWGEQNEFLGDVDPDLLKAAEEKLESQTSHFSHRSDFFLEVYQGELCLCIEVILYIDSSAEKENGTGGGIDHEHKFFRERITK